MCVTEGRTVSFGNSCPSHRVPGLVGESKRSIWNQSVKYPNSFSHNDLEDGAEVNARQNDSTADSCGEEEDYGTDDDNNVMSTKEDTYHRVLEYAMYMESLAQDLQSKSDAPIMKLNVTEPSIIFSSRVRYSRPDAEECDERLKSILMHLNSHSCRCQEMETVFYMGLIGTFMNHL